MIILLAATSRILRPIRSTSSADPGIMVMQKEAQNSHLSSQHQWAPRAPFSTTLELQTEVGNLKTII
ncbi:hypothetical protein L218DRAFT_173737 [Marasmius fiardii PR-910]|nr:hypothetical protein L218DRAFT_173737 [Marasmius fiardii PR-910]